jgi:hypothetical protein
MRRRPSHPIVFVAPLLFLVACHRELPQSSFDRPFDPVVWQKPESHEGIDPHTPRQRMLADLMRKVLPGKSRTEIEALLGPSLDSPYFRASGRDLIYFLGPERGLISIDSEWLLIWLDAQGRFKEARLARD